MMRILRLVLLATEVEGVRLRRAARRAATRAMLGAIAVLFAGGGVLLLQVAGIAWLSARLGLPLAAAIVAAVDLVLAIGFMLAAAGERRDPMAAEMQELRQKVRGEIAASAGRTALFGDVLLRILKSVLAR